MLSQILLFGNYPTQKCLLAKLQTAAAPGVRGGFQHARHLPLPFRANDSTIPPHLVRFNRDYPQPMTPDAANHFTAFTENLTTIIHDIQSETQE